MYAVFFILGTVVVALSGYRQHLRSQFKEMQASSEQSQSDELRRRLRTANRAFYVALVCALGLMTFIIFRS